jgi:hypothetical protein
MRNSELNAGDVFRRPRGYDGSVFDLKNVAHI